MKHLFLPLLLAAFFISSCKRSAGLEPHEDKAALHEQFHGKYKIISSIADQPLDLNFDSSASADLSDELLNLANCNLELRLIKGNPKNVFNEFWPEPVFGGSNGQIPITYDASRFVDYANQGVSRTFAFSKDIKNILLDADYPYVDQQRYTRPSAVNILPGNRIELIKTKKFYTTSGWKEVRVVTIYERYTKTT